MMVLDCWQGEAPLAGRQLCNILEMELWGGEISITIEVIREGEIS